MEIYGRKKNGNNSLTKTHITKIRQDNELTTSFTSVDVLKRNF